MPFLKNYITITKLKTKRVYKTKSSHYLKIFSNFLPGKKKTKIFYFILFQIFSKLFLKNANLFLIFHLKKIKVKKVRQDNPFYISLLASNTDLIGI